MSREGQATELSLVFLPNSTTKEERTELKWVSLLNLSNQVIRHARVT